MSDLDEFARSTVAPTLRPGEWLLAIGWMGNGRKWRNNPERYFAVGTNQRLVVIQTTAGVMFGTPQIGNRGVTAYELTQLVRANTGDYGALTSGLGLTTSQGSTTYAVPSPSIVGGKSVEGHPDFVNTYLPWLCRNVAAGTLRTPEGTMAAAAEWQNRPALADANYRYRILTGSTTTKATQYVRWPVALAILFLIPIALGFAMKHDAAREIGYAESHIEFMNRPIPEGVEIQYDPAELLATDLAKIEAAKSKQTQGTLVIALGPIGFIGFMILAVVLTKRKRAAARAAAASGAPLPT